ncbi:hypothetical protein [Nocardia abscessus]|uniref:hypothetical protein n=1 Tax=Nocardia abscessus TaxID=120957 RepID=UPI0024575C02|nr:hypothetical protein [Nocardia abscessus]
MLLRRARADLLDCDDALAAEAWASGRFGEAWGAEAVTDRDVEHELCMEVVGRACTTPTRHGLAAVAALARVAPPSETTLLAETIDLLAEQQPLPLWYAQPGWSPAAAWRAVDVWDSERVLFVEFDGPRPHTVLAQLTQAGGLLVGKLGILAPDGAQEWDAFQVDQEIPMPLRQAPVGDVLAELAHALRMTDMTFPRTEDEDFLGLRALAWSRSRDHLPDWPEHPDMPDAQRQQLIDDFVGETGRDDDSTRFLAQLFLDYGEGHITAGPLHWSPAEVMLLLTDGCRARWCSMRAIVPHCRKCCAAGCRSSSPGVVSTSNGLPRWMYISATSARPSTTKPAGARQNRSLQRWPAAASTSPTARTSTTPSALSTPSD